MAKFDFTAVPLRMFEQGGAFTIRQMDLMSSDTIRRQFEAKDVAEVHQRLDEICADIKTGGKSWSAWVNTAKGERAPRGFRAEKERNAFDRDINVELVTKQRAAA